MTEYAKHKSQDTETRDLLLAVSCCSLAARAMWPARSGDPLGTAPPRGNTPNSAQNGTWRNYDLERAAPDGAGSSSNSAGKSHEMPSAQQTIDGVAISNAENHVQRSPGRPARGSMSSQGLSTLAASPALQSGATAGVRARKSQVFCDARSPVEST